MMSIEDIINGTGILDVTARAELRQILRENEFLRIKAKCYKSLLEKLSEFKLSEQERKEFSNAMGEEKMKGFDGICLLFGLLVKQSLVDAEEVFLRII